MRFVGRSEELSTLSRLVERPGLVTVLGPPGVGKSRLAAELAERTRDRYRGGVVVCDLTDVSDVESVCAKASHALGIPLGPVSCGAAAVARLGEALTARASTLLVLDGFERVAAHAPATVAAWQRAPALHLLVTSRERLSLAGEVLFDLEPLPIPRDAEEPGSAPAVQLFLDRVRQVRHDFTVDAADRLLLVQLMAHLDGLPLAIELAASRMRVLSLRQLVASLPRRFQVLTSEARPGQARRALLWDEIGRSFSLLRPWEQAALAQCSVFRGGFTLEAAAAVIELAGYPGAPPWTLDILQALRDKSLLRMSASRHLSGEPRFAPYNVVRDHAAEKLCESGAAEAAMRRHADYFLALGRATHAAMASQDGWLARRRMAADTENLLAVHARAEARAPAEPQAAEETLEAAWLLCGISSSQGPLEWLSGIVAGALSAAPSAPLLLRAKALEALVGLELQLGRTEASLGACERLEAEAESLPDQGPRARMLGALGEILTARGDFGRAGVCLERARALHRACGSGAGETRALAAMGVNRVEAGRLSEARLFFEQALAMAGRGDRVQEVRVGNSLGVTEIEEGLLDAAEHHFDVALRVAREIGELRYEVVITGNLAAVAQERGLLDEARRGYEAALELNRRLGSRRSAGNLHTFLGNCLFEQGRLEEARRSYQAALASFEPTEWRSAMARGPLAALRAALGDLDGACATLAAAQHQTEQAQQWRLLAALRVWEGHVDVARARALEASGDAVVSARYIRRARRRATDALCAPRASNTLEGGPALAMQSTDLRVALRCLERAIAMYARGIESPVQPGSLEIEAEGAWFCPPGWDEPVNLHRRRTLRSMLQRLLRERLAAPAVAVSIPRLVEAAWPGDNILPSAAAARVHSGMYTLRRLGLRDLLQSRDDGYLLDPLVPIVVTSGSPCTAADARESHALTDIRPRSPQA